jgi:hypothetical protein
MPNRDSRNVNFTLARSSGDRLVLRTMLNRAAATYFYFYFSYWTTSGSYRRARTS